jgi:dienelactone hydrolase
VGAGSQSVLEAAAKQANDARFGRVYTGASQYVPTYATGDPEAYHDVTPRRVFFLARTGAKLQGHVWGSEAPGPRPGVVITTGSIQGSNQMYWWAARALAAAGYVVLTYDVQGQGQSEGVGHEPGSPAPTAEGVPFQQQANFVDGTVDALRFFLSTPGEEYTPVGWSDDEVAAAKDAAVGEQVDWVNPGWAVLDRERLGIAGHSLGARAVSIVQQCSNEGALWQTVPECAGQSFPIRAVVGWDGMSSTVTPVVPGMDQRADGYFLSPSFAPRAPDPKTTLAAFTTWRDAGVDTYTVTVRGGTHLEWSQVPYHGPSTRYGDDLAAYYTVAWIDRWVPRDVRVRQQGFEALVGGPKAEPQAPWSANHLSVRHLSAMSLRRPGAEQAPSAVDVVDLRKWAGRSQVGHWKGANQDKVGSELP